MPNLKKLYLQIFKYDIEKKNMCRLFSKQKVKKKCFVEKKFFTVNLPWIDPYLSWYILTNEFRISIYSVTSRVWTILSSLFERKCPYCIRWLNYVILNWKCITLTKALFFTRSSFTVLSRIRGICLWTVWCIIFIWHIEIKPNTYESFLINLYITFENKILIF